MKKRGYELSFSWIFAIIIGAFVIFIAVYSATQIIGIKRFEDESKAGRTIGIILNPIATNLEQAKSAKILVNDETKIFNTCKNNTLFGSQEIATAVKQGNLGAPWPATTGAPSSFHDRYLFSSAEVHGKEEFYVLSKPFEFPFKVADIMLLWSDKQVFCFDGALSEITNEIGDLKLENIKTTNCIASDTKVCFAGGSNCDITVSLANKKVKHESTNKEVHYIDSFDSTDRNALLYAAIFSDPDIYECQLDRIMSRAAALSNLYIEKSNQISPSPDCGTNIIVPLEELRDSAISYSGSTSLSSIRSKAENVNEKNKNRVTCKIY